MSRSRQPARGPATPAAWRAGVLRTGALLALLGCLFAAGCASPNGERRPARTVIGSQPVTVQARLMGNALVAETKWDNFGPYHFLIDTGSSVTLVSPELAARYQDKGALSADTPSIRVKSSTGGSVLLNAAMIRRIQLGSVRFENVLARVYDCSELSAQLGLKIDGILGFPLFRETILTLDYENARLILRADGPQVPPPAGETVPFDDSQKTPVITMRMGDQTFTAMIDSGSDAALALNPNGLNPRFASGVINGPTVGTLAGERPEPVGRLDEDVDVGGYTIARPIVEITDEQSALGGGILKHFTVTFDQENHRVTFFRDAVEPVAIPPLRSTGMSFRKSPAYWRVSGVIPNSAADAAGVETGDLVIRINNEPVSQWDLRRYEELIANSDEVTYTFLNGTNETLKRLKIADLVP